MKKDAILKTMAVIIVTALMSVWQVSGQKFESYHLIDLGTLGGTLSVARGINKSGQVVGSAELNSGVSHAFLYSNGSMQDLGTLGDSHSYAYSINDNGKIVGEYWRSGHLGSRSFYYSDGTMQELGTLGGTILSVEGINNSDQIVGVASIGGNTQAFLYSGNSIQDLGTIGGTHSWALAINNSGQIVGFSSISYSSTLHAFLYSNGLMQDLGTLGGTYSQATAINDNGQIAGDSDTSGEQKHAFLYADGSMQDLGTLGGHSSRAYEINSYGHVVGFSITSIGALHAFLYKDGVMTDLNDHLISPPSGWVVQVAYGINDAGQIVGYGKNAAGQTRAFLLNPLPLGWREVIEDTPAEKTYGILPVKLSGKDNLIVVTHGWNPDVRWVRAMTNDIGQYLVNHNLTTWQVAGYEWVEEAQTISPQSALKNGKQDGYKLGKHIVSNGWTNVHFIAHSAGAGLINTASEFIHTNTTSIPITIQNTFMDAFVGKVAEEMNEYGKYANWSDNYYSSGDSPRTQSILPYAYNVDVTQLNKVTQLGTFISSGQNVGEPCTRITSSHGWPHDFYSNTITGTVTSEYHGFGFPLSKEGGGWNYALANYTPGSSTNLGIQDPDCISLATHTPQEVLNVIVAGSPVFEAGDVEKYLNGLKVATHSPSWISLVVNPTNAINFVTFDLEFTSTNSNSKGLLSVYWDANTLGSVDEQAIMPGLRRYTYAFPNASANSTHMLGFRIDPFTNMQSIAIVTNIVLGISGPSEPFYLSMTTNIVGGLKVLELTGQPDFNYTVEASTNLVNWQTIAWLVNMNRSVRFYDQDSTNNIQRFYRVVEPNSPF